ncbi:MAG: type I-MYXAN CRISPR-associated protein Cas6/Cmx6, partial [Acidiferrobacterales bacterium]
MYWSEQNSAGNYPISDDVVDVVFAMSCRCLPVDHAHALRQALHEALPWLGDDERAGIHPVHGAESGNGWMRPDNPADLLYLSRRAKLALRLPGHQVGHAGALSGRVIDVGGYPLTVGASTVRRLSPITTIFARHVVIGDEADERAFLAETVKRLGAMDVHPKKFLCGMEKIIATPDGGMRTRSLMLADLTVDES